MDTPASTSVPYITAITTLPAMIGASLGGGTFAGVLLVGGRPYGVIVSPKAEGHFPEVEWHEDYDRVVGAESYNDGLANTRAMAEAGSAIAKKVLALSTGGFGDWYIPSRDELELCYRAFKPTKRKNWTYRNGDNPSSLPPGYPYTEDSPGQTELQPFQSGGAEAFPDGWHWTSTQYAGGDGYAWIQGFDVGHQDYDHKGGEYYVRAVRRIAL